MSLSWVEATRLAAKGGPADRLRRWLIAGCAVLATLVVTVAATIPSQRSEEAVNPSVLGWVVQDEGVLLGVGLAFLIMAAPILHLTVQVVRIGAPGRDRRLRALQAAGATCGDVRRVVAAEALVWTVVGAVLGVVAYYAFMLVAPRVLRVEYADFAPNIGAWGADVATGSVPVLQLSVWPHPLVVIGAALVVPAVAGLLLPMSTRQLELGSGAPQDDRPMSRLLAWTLLGSTTLAAASIIGLIVAPLGGDEVQRLVVNGAIMLLMPLTLVLFVALLTVGAADVSARLGRALARSGHPSSLLAGRLMLARPRFGSRVAVTLVLVAFVGGVAIALRGVMTSDLLRNAQERGWDPDVAQGRLPTDVLYYTVPFMAVETLAVVSAMLGAVGLLVAVAEQVATRGQGLAVQVAAGVPRDVMRRALVVEATAPAAVMTSVALAVGVLVPTAAVAVTGNFWMLEGVAWWSILALWVVLVGGAGVASWIGGFALPSAAEPQRIRDRE